METNDRTVCSNGSGQAGQAAGAVRGGVEGAQPGQARAATSALSVQQGGGHYKGMAIQPVEYIHANGLGFCEGSVVKYISRWKSKGGIGDLEKARHFVDLLIELEKRGSK